MRFMLSLAIAALIPGWVLASPARSGPCPPGLSAPNAPGPSGAVTIVESRVLGGPYVFQPTAVDCLFDAKGNVRAALFSPALGLPAGEIVVFEEGGPSLGRAGRTLPAPDGALRFDSLPPWTRQQLDPLIQDAAEPNPARTESPAWSSPATLRAASYNPLPPQPATASARLRVTSRTYDNLDRLQTETVSLEDGGTATIRHTYWRSGVRKTTTDAFGRVTFYEYDGLNRLKRVTIDQGLPDEQVFTYDYWPDSLLKSIHAPNRAVTSYTYDGADRLTRVAVEREGAVLLSYDYVYDANGNRTSQVEVNGGAAETTTYGYDALDRLETVTYPDDTSVTYAYDAVGNRVGETERDAGGAVVSHKVAVFDAINRLSTLTDSVDPSNNATFTYDANGNLRSKTTASGTERYDYDERDLLVETREGTAITARFAYDAFGRRYLKIGTDGLRQYQYDETSLLQELDSEGREVAKYEYGSDRLLSLLRPAEPRRFYHQDALGSVTALTDAGGAVAARYHLDAWGRYRRPSELEASANRFGFTGYLFDEETSLYYAKARYFDPDFGRFLTQDSHLGKLDEPPSLHRYLYAIGNPTRYVDPTGHAIFAVQDINSLEEEVRNYNPRTDQTYVAAFDRLGNDTLRYKGVSPILWNILAQSGGKEGAANTLAALRAARFRNYAVTITEKSDYSNGVLNTDQVYQQFLGRVGGFADDMPGMKGAFVASLGGAALGQSRDISLTYNIGYEYSAARAHAVADQSSSTMPFVGGWQRTGTLIGLGTEGLAPGDFATSYSVELGLDAALTAAGGVSIYRAGANLLQAAAKAPKSGPLPGESEFIGPTTPEYRIAPHGLQLRPSRPFASHHGVQRRYLEANIPGYDAEADPTIMLNDEAGGPHRAITGEQATERALLRRTTGNPYGGDYGEWRARAIEQMRRNGVPEGKIGQWVLEHDAYLFDLSRNKP